MSTDTMTQGWARPFPAAQAAVNMGTGAPRAGGSLGGVMSWQSLGSVLADQQEQARARAEADNAKPMVQGLAAHIHSCWADAKSARADVTTEMIEAARSLEGKYTTAMETQLAQQRGSTIYMMLFAAKARAMKALVGDVILLSGSDKPWTLAPTPKPDLPDDVVAGIFKETVQVVAQAEASGQPMDTEQVRQMLRDARDKADNALNAEARHRVGMEERRMEDMLLEGGFYPALSEFLDDMAPYPTAFIKGPVVRRVGTLRWQAGPDGAWSPVVDRALVPQWERVDPMRMYPARGARSVQDGYLIELHDLGLDALEEMKGVPGYSDDAINMVITENASGLLSHAWAFAPPDRADLERPRMGRPAQTVQALQFWGRVPGQLLRDWGMDESEVPDATTSYDVEAWLIDRWVIRAIINTDPLARRPYYACSYDPVPGRVWGRSLYAAMRDCQLMCNAAARALDINMGISSGPQVGVDVDRMPAGESITEMYPWKIWQFGSSASGSTLPPLTFFQPDSHANELMLVYEKFSVLADEYTGIPRYMTGSPDVGGAGRTASGMSMMIGNASKTVKNLVANVDRCVFTPLLTDLHTYIMRFVDDPSIKGDVNVVARGAQSMAVKEAAQVRRNEFLAATANPIDMQIVGVEGRAALLRETAKTLDIDPDTVVPPISDIRLRLAQAQQAQMQAMAAQGQQGQQGQQPAPPGKPDQTQLVNGAPVTQNFDQRATG